jgi:hypothetical protein
MNVDVVHVVAILLNSTFVKRYSILMPYKLKIFILLFSVISGSIEITDTNFSKVFNFWKVEGFDNQYFRPLSKMPIISVELLMYRKRHFLYTLESI